MRITRILLAVICTALFTSGCSEPKRIEEGVKHAGMPPGFILVTNQLGEWRAAFESGDPLIPYPNDDGGREDAIARAWGYYEYKQNEDSNVWNHAK